MAEGGCSVSESTGVLGKLIALCGSDRPGRLPPSRCEKLPESGSDGIAMARLREAVRAVNLLLPTPVTLEAAVKSADGVRRLVRGQSLAKTYETCLRKLECLSKHIPGVDNPSLDAVVQTHAENVKRMADTCAAALLHMYMSVDSPDGTDAFVDHAIQLTATTELAMQDVALAEKALGLKPLGGRSVSRSCAPAPTPVPQCNEHTGPRRSRSPVPTLYLENECGDAVDGLSDGEEALLELRLPSPCGGSPQVRCATSGGKGKNKRRAPRDRVPCEAGQFI